MAYKITFTKRFVKNVKRLSAAERTQLKKKLELLMQDPLYPSLRTKRIQGTTDLFEFSVNMDVRVIWQYDGDTIILLLDIGHRGARSFCMSATATTTAGGRNREELLGQRPARCKRQRSRCWEPQPVLACGETLQNYCGLANDFDVPSPAD